MEAGYGKGLNKNGTNKKAVGMALAAALLYGISSPASKLLLEEIPPTLMAALLYLGAGMGMSAVNHLLFREDKQKEAKLSQKDIPYTVGMIVLDIAAPVFLMLGLTLTSSANAALLNNFEIVATALIAFMIFKEAIGRRMWLAITLITISSIVLTVKDMGSLSFTPGSVFVLMACVCWGIENNCTRMLSMKNPLQIVIIKGFGSGAGSLLISIADGQYSRNVIYIGLTLLLGFVAYGMSICLYIFAQRTLGAARTSAFYATAPFIGVVVSFLVFREGITVSFLAALVIMLAGTYFAVSEYHIHEHSHQQITHEHKHSHGSAQYDNEDGQHLNGDEHHLHRHSPVFIGEHSHEHTHEAVTHSHVHTPDIHHNHKH